jgi:predicted RNA methylase
LRFPYRHAGNGFTSLADMKAAHRPIVEFVTARWKDRTVSILDLGCGNGALLASLAAANRRVTANGIDCDSAGIAQARQRHPALADRFRVSDMFDLTGSWARDRFDITLLMPGRLLERAEPDRAALRAWLRDRGGTMVVYAYGDTRREHGSLAAICARAGLRLDGRGDAPVGIAYVPE